MIKPWTKGYCGCGEEGYITRTQEKPDDAKYTCPECEMYDHGYDNGFQDGYNEGFRHISLATPTLALDYFKSYKAPLFQPTTEKEALEMLIESHKRLREQNAERWNKWRVLPKWKKLLLDRLGLSLL